MEYVDRNNEKLLCIEEYKLILETETHHDHKIVTVNGVYRWEEDSDVRTIKNTINLNSLTLLLELLGYGKNSEIYRKLYRCMGYSLFGYWEVFYWELNNPEAINYAPGRSEEN